MSKLQALQRSVSSLALKRTVLSYAPTAYWLCDESAGPTFYDHSGNGYNLTANGNIEYQRSHLIIGDETKFATFRNGSVAGAERPGSLGQSVPITGAVSAIGLCMCYSSPTTDDYLLWVAIATGETEATNLQFSLRIHPDYPQTFWERGSGTDVVTVPTGVQSVAIAGSPMLVGVSRSAGGTQTFYLNGRKIGSSTTPTLPTGGTGAVGSGISRSTSYLNGGLSKSWCMGHLAFWGGVELDRFAHRQFAINSGHWGLPL